MGRQNIQINLWWTAVFPTLRTTKLKYIKAQTTGNRTNLALGRIGKKQHVLKDQKISAFTFKTTQLFWGELANQVYPSVPRSMIKVSQYEVSHYQCYCFHSREQMGRRGCFYNEFFCLPFCLLLDFIHRCLLKYNVDVCESSLQSCFEICFGFCEIFCILLTLEYIMLS